MDESDSEKQAAINEINRLIDTWELEYCRRLLTVAERLHETATTPPPTNHACDEAGPLDAAAIEELGMGRVHIGENGKPRCHNRGDSLRLRSIEDFKKVPIIERCMTCDRLLAGEPAPWDNGLAALSDQQRAFLRAIRERTQDAEQGDAQAAWCPVADLSDDKTSSGRTSLHRSLRRLERRGLIVRKTNAKNRTLVRLMDRDRSTEPGTISDRSGGL